MAATWSEAPAEVIELARRIIDKYHPSLMDASIGFVMRSEAPRVGGKTVLGKTRKVTAEQQVHIDFDFIIWLAEDVWSSLSPRQKEALIDHELSHCKFDGFTASIVPHDVEEFTHIIDRYGFWWPASDAFEASVQHALELEQRQGGVRSMDLRAAGDAFKGEMSRMGFDGIDVGITRGGEWRADE